MSTFNHILLSHDFYTKPRNRKWLHDQGAEAMIILQALWLASSQERTCKIRKEEAPYLPYPYPIEPTRITEILDSAVAVGLLDADEEHYFNSQIVEDKQNVEKKQENYRNAKLRNKENQHVTRIVEQSSNNPPTILQQRDRENQILLNNEHTEYRTNELMNEGGVGGEPPRLGLKKLSTRVYITEIDYPLLLQKYRNSGFSNADKALEHAVMLVEGHYELKNTSGAAYPAKCFKDLASWALRDTLQLKAEKARTDAAEKRKTNAQSTAPPQPRANVPNAEETKKLLQSMEG